MTLSADQTLSLVDFFKDVPDPRRGQGRRHRLATILALAAAATLAGMRGYKAMSDWVDHLGQAALARFRCRRENGRYVVPSLTTIRDALVRTDPVAVDRALQRFHAVWEHDDTALAIDGKTMCNAIDEHGRRTHIMSVVGHETGLCHTQKKLANCR